MSAGRILAAIFSGILALVGAALLIGGTGLLMVNVWQGNDAQFWASGSYDVTTPGYAIVSEPVDYVAGPQDWVPPDLVTIGLDVASTEEVPIFIGIARTADLREYLDGVAYATVADVQGRELVYRNADGAGPATPPGDQDFWVTSATGVDPDALTFELSNGQWAAVVMNADGSAGISATAAAGVDLGVLRPLAWALVAVGLVMLVLGIVLFVVALATRPPQPQAPQTVAPRDVVRT